MSYIEFNKITKIFSEKNGISNIDLKIEKGETLGIIGINGAGKTTLIRHLMGFVKQNSGKVTVAGLDPWKDAAILKDKIAYIPGEIGFPLLPTGDSFLKAQSQLEGVNNLSKSRTIAKDLALDTRAKLKTMSKGMKQKTAIVSAFIRDKEILIFDEPTTGLDPLMRDTFIELINNEKAKGKTIIFSTHIFLEAERCCDNVIFIDSGKIIDRINIEKLVHNENKLYRLGFASPLELTKFTKENKICKIHKQKDDSLQIIVTVPNAQIQKFIKYLTRFKLKFFSEIKHSLAHKFKEAFAPRKEQS